MGSIASKEFEEILEDIQPSSPAKCNRVLDDDFDPRSPSVGITRTPIHVLKTPQHLDDPRSPSQEINRTPVAEKKDDGYQTPVFKIGNVPKSLMLNDPRSPTQGIERTPICSLQAKTDKPTHLNNCATPKGIMVDDPRSPTQGIDRTPICLKEKKTDGNLAVPAAYNESVNDMILNDPRSPTAGIERTPLCAKSSEEQKCSDSTEVYLPSSDIFEEPIKMSSLEDFVDSLNDPLETITVKDDCLVEENLEPKKDFLTKKQKVKKQKTLMVIHTNVDTKDDSTEGLKPSARIRSPLKLLGDRSPLSGRNVDYNSPRAIVQRKQTGKLSIKKASLQMKPMKNSSKYKTLDEDKENM